MSRDNVDVVRAIYAAWTEDASAGGLIASDMEYVNPSCAVETGSPKDRRTLAKIRDI